MIILALSEQFTTFASFLFWFLIFFPILNPHLTIISQLILVVFDVTVRVLSSFNLVAWMGFGLTG